MTRPVSPPKRRPSPGRTAASAGKRGRSPINRRTFADPAARAALEEAAALDVLLDASPRPVPSAALAARILAAAPKAREARAHLGRIFWFLGAGWAAAACAGVVAGVGLTTHLTADEQADAVLYQATLSGVDDTEVLG